MKRGGERTSSFHGHDTRELGFQPLGNRTTPALRGKSFITNPVLHARRCDPSRPIPQPRARFLTLPARFLLPPSLRANLLPVRALFSFPIPPWPLDPAPWILVVAPGGEAEEGKGAEAAVLE